ncbi:MAG TPA: glycosyl hydrolase-related protein [Gemmatimonadales bacterium]|nr:glycosyl hydrolase-related protein [Gemmatimonadales bacterium]
MPADPLVFHLIPHTHWDREWYLPRAGFLARLVPAIDDLVRRLEVEPGFRSFLLDGQTVLLEDYLAVRPEQAPRVEALVRAGRLQVGPWYVLADELIPSAESLVRNLLLGAADCRRLGDRLEVLYSPDAFGHPAVWPTLARGFGLGHGVLWRGLGDGGGTPSDFVRWTGPDGAEVLVYHLPPDGYEIGSALPADLLRLPEAWRRIRPGLVARAATRHVAVFVGADHHAAHPSLPHLRDLLAELEPGHEVRISRLDEFLRCAAAALDGSAPALTGELRWSYGYTWTLQGTHGTRARQKRRNAGLELLLERYVEPLAALAGAHAGGDLAPLAHAAWRLLVQCHFHDAICGTAADEVARALDVRFGEVEAMGLELVRRSVDALAGHDPDQAREEPALAEPALVLWNPAARRRGGVTIAELTFFRRDVLVGPPGGRVPREGAGFAPFALRSADGGIVPVQPLDRRPGLERLDAARHYPDQDEVDVVRVAFAAPPLAGLGLARLAPAPPARLRPARRVTVKGRALRNDAVEVTIRPDGSLVLLDRRSGERYGPLLALESEGDVGDCYTWCPPDGDEPVTASEPIRSRILAAGPLVGAIEARWYGPRGCPARLVATLHADSPAVRCLLEVDNRARDHRLRARSHTGLPGVPALAGAQFGWIAREPVIVDPADYPVETPVATAPAHRFVAVAGGGREGRRGLALLAPGFFEYEWTPAGDLIFTVLRAVGELSRPDLPTRPGHAGWPTPTPLAQEPGRHRVELALLPLAPGELARRTPVLEAWEDVFLPVRGFWRRQCTAADEPSPRSVELQGDGLVLSAVKPAESGEGVILRCYNVSQSPVGGRWILGWPIGRAERTRLDETPVEPLPVQAGGREVPFRAGPREIITILVV